MGWLDQVRGAGSNAPLLQYSEDSHLKRADNLPLPLVLPKTVDGINMMHPLISQHYEFPNPGWVAYARTTTPMPAVSAQNRPSLIVQGGNVGRLSGTDMRKITTAMLQKVHLG